MIPLATAGVAAVAVAFVGLLASITAQIGADRARPATLLRDQDQGDQD